MNEDDEKVVKTRQEGTEDKKRGERREVDENIEKNRRVRCDNMTITC